MNTPQFLLKGYRYNNSVADQLAFCRCNRYRFDFDNGYGASVVSNRYTNGGKQGYWELAVLDNEGHILYDTPITSDVEGFLTDQEVSDLLDAINNLPPIK